MKMRNVIESEKCYTKDMYSVFSEKKGKNYYNGIIIRELFKKYGINYNNKDIIDIVKDKMPLDVFHTSREEIINTTLLVLRLLRFQEFFTKERLSPNAIVHNGGVTFVTKHNIEVDYNLIIEEGDQIEIVKVKNKKSDLSKTGKSVHTKISDNMELFLLSEAAKKLFPGKISYNATIVFLRHPKDSGNNLIPTSDFAKGKTIASTSFVGSKVDEMLNRIDDILIGKSKHECSDCSTCAYNLICKYKKDETNLLVIPQKAKASSNVQFTNEQKEVIEKNADLINDQDIHIEEVSSSHLEIEYIGNAIKIATTIPYDEGWSIYDNGQKVEIQSNWDSFISFELGNQSNHKIKMVYYPKGLKTGIAISSLSLLILAVYVVYDKKKRV